MARTVISAARPAPKVPMRSSQPMALAGAMVAAPFASKAIAGLFANGGQPIEIIKWKDIYGHLEAAIDKCEDVANIIERITIKHA